jgi:hypothetical protein
MMTPVDIDEIQALTRMAARAEPFAATIARATLAIVEARYDAEFRAEMSELALANAEAKLVAIRDLVATLPNDADPRDMVRRIADLCAG